MNIKIIKVTEGLLMCSVTWQKYSGSQQTSHDNNHILETFCCQVI